MTEPPRLADRATLALHRARATRTGPETFVFDLVADEIEERVSEVNRTFSDICIVTGFPDYWSRRFPEAHVIDDSDVLDVEEARHDLVIHALSLHWASDPIGQIVQCRRALRPDGLFIAAMFGGRSLSELRAVLAESETELTGGLSPRVVPMGEIRDLGGLLQRAGLALPVADSDIRTITYASLSDLVRDLRGMGETNALAARRKAVPPRALFPQAAACYRSAYPAEDGRLRATLEIIYLTGWAPSPEQQKPLRPGSAASRLAEALGTTELTLPPNPIKRDE